MHVLPNLVLDLLLSVASIGNSIVVVSGAPFYVVSPSSDSEEFYLKLSRLGAFNETSHTREDVLCATILKRPFFATEKTVEMVDPNNVRAYAEFHPERKGWSMFTRPYKVVNVSIQEYATPHQEAVFPCLAELEGTNERKMYLISRVYDFDRWTEKRSIRRRSRVTGQFVFEYSNTAENMAKLIAVAEEPAQIFEYKTSEYENFDSLKGDLDAIGNGGRSICEFPTGWKVRICSVALNAIEYRSQVTFLPFKNSIQPECEMKELRFKNEWHSFQFMEWVIGCKTTDPHRTYLVSLGYEPYQFLIFWPEGTHPDLTHHFDSYLGANNSEYFRDRYCE